MPSAKFAETKNPFFCKKIIPSAKLPSVKGETVIFTYGKLFAKKSKSTLEEEFDLFKSCILFVPS